MGFSLTDIAKLRIQLRNDPAFCQAGRVTARRRPKRNIVVNRLLSTNIFSLILNDMHYCACSEDNF